MKGLISVRKLASVKGGFELRVFISHSSKDNSVATALADRIRQASPRAHVWEFGEHAGFARDIWQANVLPALQDADVFLLLCSKHSAESEGIAREIGMLDVLLKKNKWLRPAVIGVLLEGDAPLAFETRDFFTGALNEGSLDISSIRNFNLDDQRAGRLSLLVEMLMPRVRFFGARNSTVVPTENPTEIPAHAFECLEHLFPIEDERNAPDEISRWLQVSYEGETHPTSFLRRTRHRTAAEYFAWKWAEMLATLEVADKTVGVAHLSIDRRSGWVFGKYFGVLETWR
jgi:hypothetical protein